jgi:hypothetical protein
MLAVIAIALLAISRPSAGEKAGQAQPAAPGSTTTKAAAPVGALTDSGWPRIVPTNDGKITVYQPQIDSWDGFRVDGRAAVAVSLTAKPNDAPTYGIVTFSAQAHVDKDAGMVSFEKLTVKSASFPGAAANGQKWATAIQNHSRMLKPIAIERFQASLAVMEAEQKADETGIKNDPPVIEMSTVPSMLILVDGEPVYRDVPGTRLTRVLNTRPLVLKDASGRHYLKIFDGWMQAPSLTGDWVVASSVPPDCNTALKAVIDQKVADLLVGGDPKDPKSAPSLKKQVPKIFVATKPTELIVFDGEPKFVPVTGTGLIYAENTTGHLFVDSGNQRAYVLVTGRWFDGPSSLKGPWSFVPGDKLSGDFPMIPDDSPVENVKASIPGTEQAEEAVVANSIPQTAQVTRSQAKFSPTYDGTPKIEPIQGTQMHYVSNASQPIVVVGSPAEYFGVQNAVWFVSTSLEGPWLVATTVPSVIYSIPASSPLHYVTYVKIYDYTPDYVIVGYTPGYTGVYVSGGCIVYGTGYYYAPWVGTVWYGPPVTYGFGVGIAYTPWAGWHVGFGFGWTWGVATVAVGWGWGPYPWWGGYGWGAYYPWAYRPGGVVAWGPRGGVGVWGPGYFSGTTGNIYHRWGSTTAVTRATGGYNAWTGQAWAGRAGRSYNSRTGVASAGQRGAVGNVYTGNYAAGSRGAAVNTRTGAAAAGRSETVGNAYTGNSATARQGVVRGPNGQVQTYNSIRGDEGGAARIGNNVYAGRDGNVYRNNGSGWEHYTPGSGWSNTGGAGDARLNRERTGRINGNWQSGAARSGGFHGGWGGGFGGGRSFGGGRRR